jgi:hypothetical protein
MVAFLSSFFAQSIFFALGYMCLPYDGSLEAISRGITIGKGSGQGADPLADSSCSSRRFAASYRRVWVPLWLLAVVAVGYHHDCRRLLLWKKDVVVYRIG